MKPSQWLSEQPLEQFPFEHQLHYVTCHLDLPYWALFWEMGTGKSYAISLTAAYLYHMSEIRGVLIVAQNGVHTGWANKKFTEYWVWDDPQILAWDSYKIHTKRYQKELNNLCDFTYNTNLKVFCTSFDAFTWKKKRGAKRAVNPSKGWEAASQFIKACSGKVLMVLDESSMIKDPKSNRTKQLLKLRHLVSHRRVMSGTPMTENPFNLWPQAEFLSRGLSGFEDYFQFQQHYAWFETMYYGKKEFKQVAGYRHLDELQERVKTFSTQHLKSECLDLPEKLYKEVPVPLTEEQRKAYDQLLEEARMEVQGTELTPESAMKRMHMLQNILLGYVVDNENPENPITVYDLANHRIKSLLDVLHNVQGQAVIWVSYNLARSDVFGAIRKEFSDSVEIADGSTPQEERTVLEQRFLNQEYRFLVANPKVMGYYYELYTATAEVYYDQNPSLETRLQSEDRVHRQGLKHAVTIIDLLSNGSRIDSRFRHALEKKVDVAENILELAKEWLK